MALVLLASMPSAVPDIVSLRAELLDAIPVSPSPAGKFRLVLLCTLLVGTGFPRYHILM